MKSIRNKKFITSCYSKTQIRHICLKRIVESECSMVVKTMSTSEESDELIKKPIKYLEIPINKFNNEAIPHHLELLKKLKLNIKKVSSVFGQTTSIQTLFSHFLLLVSKYSKLGWSLHRTNLCLKDY